jgi:hypothetical protein
MSGSLSKIFGKKKKVQAPKDTLKDPFQEAFKKEFFNIKTHVDNMNANAAMSMNAHSYNPSGGAANSYIRTITAPNTGGQYAPMNPTPGVAPSPLGGGLNVLPPNTWTYKTWMDPNSNGLDQFPAGLVHDRVEEYLNKRGKETMRGIFEHDFLINVLGLVPEEMKDRWFILKDKGEMTDDPTVCSNVRGKGIPLLHKCKEEGKYYSKTETNMTGDHIWCAHCEEDLPEDLETMLVISHVM